MFAPSLLRFPGSCTKTLTMNTLQSFFPKAILLTLAIPALIATSCDKDNGNYNEQELITTVQLTFTDTSSGNSLRFSAEDLDGDGGNPPVTDTVRLKVGTTYKLSVGFLDESDANHSHDLTAEIRQEAEEHLVCFAAAGAMPLPLTTDQDSQGKPLGLENALTTGGAGEGSLQVSLKHEPDKSSINACLTGETDAEVTFQVEIE